MEASTANDLFAFQDGLASERSSGTDTSAIPGSLASLLECNGIDGVWLMVQMIQQSPVSIVVTGAGGEIEYVNDRFTLLTGYSRGEVIGKNPRILQSGLTPPETFRDMWRTIAHSVWRGEFINRKKNGELFWEAATVGPMRDTAGRITHFLAVKEDITERKRLEREHQLMEERLRLAASLASDVMYEFDPATLAIRLLSPMREEWCVGKVPSNVDEWFESIHPEDREGVRAGFELSLHTGQLFSQEYRARRVDGGWNVWRNRALPTGDAGPRHTKWVGVLVNVNREKAIQQQLADLAECLKSKNYELQEALRQANTATEMKGRFLANMSHEIRTPLNGIIGTAEMLLNLEPNAEQRDCAQVIRDCGLSLLTVLNDVLDISKLQAGKMELQHVPFEPPRTVAEVIHLMRPLATDKQLVLELEVDPDLPGRVMGDPIRVSQVLTNLISNAIKFTQAGGVTVHLSSPCGECLQYAVKDTGIGVPATKQNSIFESFVQADSTLARKFGGTGLGLAICKQLAHLMGGDITVTSREGQGSTFTLITPLIPAPADTDRGLPDEGESRAAPTQDSGVILLAEDNPLNQRIVGRLLEKAGYRIAVASNGREALQVVDAGSVDLVLMDVQMPEMDGMETARRIRARPGGGAMPIIALTANAMPGDREEYLGSGMDDYLAKPISYAVLLSKVRHWIAARPRVK